MTQAQLLKRHRAWFWVLPVLPVAYYALFHRLGSLPVQMWDESRLAVNAVEMARNGNWLVTTYAGQPDLWNTKPPLLIWLQALFFRLLGPTELTLRLPSAIAGLATVGLVGRFAYRHLGGTPAAVFGTLVLLTSDGYVDLHVTRTGDYDALLVLWVTGYILAFFRYLHQGSPQYLYWTAVGLALALLTKGVAGALPLPGLLLYAVWQKKLSWLLQQRRLYVSAAAVVAAAGSYYLSRELANPGYLRAVYENELGGRLLKVLEEHEHPWYWYAQAIANQKFVPWLYFLPVGFLLSWQIQKNSGARAFTGLAACFVSTYLLLISLSKTKLYWYDAPLYPMAALVVGLGLAMLLQAVVPPGRYQLAVQVALVACVFAAPLLAQRAKLRRLYAERYNQPELRFGGHLRDQHRVYPGINSYVLLAPTGYNASAEFYAQAARLRYGDQAELRSAWQVPELRPGQTVVVCSPDVLAEVTKRFETTLVYSGEHGSTLLLNGHKP